MLLRSLLTLCLTALPYAAHAAYPVAPPGGMVKALDLSKPFGLPSGWRFTAIQAPPLDDHGETVPGRITLCIKRNLSGWCDPALENEIVDGIPPQFGGPHFLHEARLVYPRGPHAPPLLLIRASSLEAFNGNRAIVTQLIAYDSARRAFRRVYRSMVGWNNNEEVRYIGSGRLTGGVISAVPQLGLPYGYWITVNTLTPAYTYKQVLRYRSATIYGDGNRLSVIDSEMPNIQRRLGLWHPGMPLPLPPNCRKPHLVHTSLWCQ